MTCSESVSDWSLYIVAVNRLSSGGGAPSVEDWSRTHSIMRAQLPPGDRRQAPSLLLILTLAQLPWQQLLGRSLQKLCKHRINFLFSNKKIKLLLKPLTTSSS